MEPTAIPFEPIGPANSRLGEGPVWDDARAMLHYVDITGRKLHHLNWETGGFVTRELPQSAGCLGLTDGDAFVLAMEDGIYLWDGDRPEPAHKPVPIAGERFNDGKPGPDGRFYAGTIGPGGKGCLYVLDHTRELRVLLEGVSTSNGLDWSPDGNLFYYVDTSTRRVDAFAFDGERGRLGKASVAVAIPPELGWPDGLTVDAEGMIWIALWNGSGILKANPSTGEHLALYSFPASRTSCPAFAGPGLDTLVVTSSADGIDIGSQPLAGCTFAAKVAAKGRLPYRFALNDRESKK